MAECSVRCVFHFATNRRRDRDNLLGWLKPAFDGLTDAGVWVDDSGVEFLAVEIGERSKVEFVEVEVV